jgi:hypothetical protein
MVPLLADNVDGEEQFLAARHVVDRRGAPCRGVVFLKPPKSFGQKLVVELFLRTQGFGGGLVQPALVDVRFVPPVPHLCFGIAACGGRYHAERW